MKTGLVQSVLLLMSVVVASAAGAVPISAIRAVFYPPLTNINVSFSGGVGASASAADAANYRLIAADGTRIPGTRTEGGSHTNISVYWDGLALPGNFRSIEVANVTDMSPNPARLPIERYVLFGRPGTPAAEDVQLSAHPSLGGVPLGFRDTITVAADPDYPTAMSQALIRFPLPGGADLAPIPAGATITDAHLVLVGPMGGAGREYSLHRMLVPWNETNATWNSLVNGVATNNVEASAVPEIVFEPIVTAVPVVMVPVTARVLDWLRGGTPNYGWLIQPRTSIALHFWSAQSVPSQRPSLRISYVLPPELQIERGTNSVRLSWDVLGFRLQHSDALNSMNWFDTLGGQQSAVNVAPTNLTRFFRLYRPPQ